MIILLYTSISYFIHHFHIHHFHIHHFHIHHISPIYNSWQKPLLQNMNTLALHSTIPMQIPNPIFSRTPHLRYNSPPLCHLTSQSTLTYLTNFPSYSYWDEPSDYTPESRLEMYGHMKEVDRKKNEKFILFPFKAIISYLFIMSS